MKKRKLQAEDQLFCLNNEFAMEGCFYPGRRYRVTKINKDKKGNFSHAMLSCEAGCDHVIYGSDVQAYFRVPQIPDRSLPPWW
jgi:hypothetical protein